MRSFPEPDTPLVAPSILAGDHADLASSLRMIENAGVPWVHLDIMDGHFVPNLTFGPQTVADLRRRSSLFFDVHLMLSRPDQHVGAFLCAGADLISVHVEPDYDLEAVLHQICAHGSRCGIVLNPDTAAERVIPYLQKVDLVLQMTVFPGFGGQAFIESTLRNIKLLRDFRDSRNLNYRIEVDGGIDLNTSQSVRNAGADTLVSGSAFFRANDPSDFVRNLLGQP